MKFIIPIVLLIFILESCREEKPGWTNDSTTLDASYQAIRLIESKSIDEFAKLFSMEVQDLLDHSLVIQLEKAERLLVTQPAITRKMIAVTEGEYENSPYYGSEKYTRVIFTLDSISFEDRYYYSFIDFTFIDEEDKKRLAAINVQDANEIIGLQIHLSEVKIELENERADIKEMLSLPFEAYRKIRFVKTQLYTSSDSSTSTYIYTPTTSELFSDKLNKHLNEVFSIARESELVQNYLGDITSRAGGKRDYFLIELTTDEHALLDNRLYMRLVLNSDPNWQLNDLVSVSNNELRHQGFDSIQAELLREKMEALMVEIPWNKKENN